MGTDCVFLFKCSQRNSAGTQRSSWGRERTTTDTFQTELSPAALQTFWLDWVYFLGTVTSSKNKIVTLTPTGVLNRRRTRPGASAGGAATGPPGPEEIGGANAGAKGADDGRTRQTSHHSCCRPSCPRCNVSRKIWPENVFTDKNIKHLCML